MFRTVRLPYVRLDRPFRVPNAGAPVEALKPDAFSANALARHCISFFANREWICVYQPSAVYRGHFCKLPRSSALDALMGPLVDHWFSIDQKKPEDAVNDPTSAGCFKGSPVHAYTVQAASSRPWTAAVLATRARHSVATDPVSNGSLPQSQQNSSDTNLYKRTHKDRNKMSSDVLLNGYTEGDVTKDGDAAYESKVSDPLSEYCNRNCLTFSLAFIQKA
ncbi:unnamed protein product [Echinostoma caproni]|uniref:Myotubularin phosphatase domain-containing protein n=1 Tax=Echinostoma caproni TaxID=27848 RepID=A0A183B5Z8_9TREM|nr:unnamed protein product [Echinostoma caproni]